MEPENTDLKTFYAMLREERAAENPDSRKIAVLDYLVSEGYMFKGWVSADKQLSHIGLGEHGNYFVTECPLSVRDDIGSGAGACHTIKF